MTRCRYLVTRSETPASFEPYCPADASSKISAMVPHDPSNVVIRLANCGTCRNFARQYTSAAEGFFGWLRKDRVQDRWIAHIQAGHGGSYRPERPCGACTTLQNSLDKASSKEESSECLRALWRHFVWHDALLLMEAT